MIETLFEPTTGTRLSSNQVRTLVYAWGIEHPGMRAKVTIRGDAYEKPYDVFVYFTNRGNLTHKSAGNLRGALGALEYTHDCKTFDVVVETADVEAE